MNRSARSVGASAFVELLIFCLGLCACTLLRLGRLFPNNDPIMAIALPYAKLRSRWIAVAFPALAILGFDFLSGRIGIWTAVTAGTYGVLGWSFSVLYARLTARGHGVGQLTYLVSGVAGVLIFDFVTGPVMSSMIFGLTFHQAVVGQVPFTIRHLASVSVYALIAAPLVEHALGWAARLEPHLISLMAPRVLRSTRRM